MAKRVIVIGGGAAGLMAAGQAAARGAQVLVLEKMSRPGRKLRITGKGRGNLTNTAPVQEFIGHFGPTGKFLRSAFGQFFNTDLLLYFEAIGVKTVEERGGRVFPASNEAQDVVEEMARWARDAGVRFHFEQRVQRIIVEQGRAAGVESVYSPFRKGRDRKMPPSSEEGRARIFRADTVVVATGGASYPATGSTGDGYRLAESVGHTVVPVRPALVPLETAGPVAK